MSRTWKDAFAEPDRPLDYSRLALRNARKARQGGELVAYHVRRNDPSNARQEAREACLLWHIATLQAGLATCSPAEVTL